MKVLTYDLGYNPDNCKWIPLEDQSNNRRCNTMLGEHSLKRACRLAEVSYRATWNRVHKQGMEPLAAILRGACISKHKIIRGLLE